MAEPLSFKNAETARGRPSKTRHLGATTVTTPGGAYGTIPNNDQQPLRPRAQTPAWRNRQRQANTPDWR
eukprot:2349570-Lingulodinium_polyedra.AAC.1